MNRIAVLGPEGTFSELAALEYMKEQRKRAKIIFLKSIHDVFDAVKNGKAEEGIVPLENLLDGSVGETLDALYHSGLKIREEIVVPVKHFLACLPEAREEEIKLVMSHQKALAQCSNFLRKKKFDTKETLSTAEAMMMIARQKLKNAAAIGTEIAAKRYGLKIIARNIEDNKNNVTRFIVVSKKAAKKGNKMSIALHAYRDRPGLLHDILESFAKRNINLTKIESRPTKLKLGEYIFYVDFEGNEKEKKIKEALEEIRKFVKIKSFGSYPKRY